MSKTPMTGETAGGVQRADIEGLRGVAILAVLAVHAWPDLLRGGFVGVDIFFVLSGFLVAARVLDDIEAGVFRIGDFYARRARRLLPALCAVLLASLVAASLTTFPAEARQIGRHVAAASIFASNVALWKEAGYFDASSESKPLLHLWSLGIEEQFYVLWPLLAWLIVRRRWPGLGVVLLLTGASFALNVWWVVPKAKGTFFLLPTRAWELLAGAALAYALRPGALAPAWQRLGGTMPRNVAGGAGAVLIVLAFALLDPGAVFPGWWALLPTGGTVLLLAAGAQAWINRRVLAHGVLVFYGSISYPLYLWHWPLLVFPLLLGYHLGAWERALVLAFSVALAVATMRFIERPLRFGPLARHAAAPLVVLLLVLGASGVALHRSDGLIDTYPDPVQRIARAEFGFDYGAYRAARCFLDLEQGPANFAPECWPDAPAARRATLLWGDSHAASLYPGLSQFPRDGAQLAQLTKARCPPLLAQPAGSSRGCAETVAAVRRRIALAPPDTVVLAGHWSFYRDAHGNAAVTMQELRHTADELRRAGVRRVVVIGSLPAWTRPVPRVVLLHWRRTGVLPQRSLASLDADAVRLDRRIGAALAGTGVRFVSPIDALCNVSGCLVSLTVDGAMHPTVHDRSHLTVAGSRWFAAASHAAIFD